MKYCEHCHAPISDTALFCTSCGTPVSKSSPASQPAKSNPVQNASAQRVQPGKTVQPAKNAGYPQNAQAVSSTPYAQNAQPVQNAQNGQFSNAVKTNAQTQSVSSAASSAASSAMQTVQAVAGSVQSFVDNASAASRPVAQRAVENAEAPNRDKTCHGVILSDGEVVIRDYVCADIRSPRCMGYLTVTNKRVLFNGEGSGSRIAQQAWIDGVTGVTAYYGRDIQISMVVGGALLLLCSPFAAMVNPLVLFLFMGLGILLIIVGLMQKCFKLSIHSSNYTGNSISFGSGPTNMLGNAALLSLTGGPTVDTNKMMDELGALIQDLQTQGDLAIKKWK